MATINPHINFNGNAEEAFTFYKSVFGGEFMTLTRFADIASPEFPIKEKDANKIMHIALPIGSSVLMGNDVPESMGRTNENENRSKISIKSESKEEAEKLFHGLSAGGQVEIPLAESSSGSCFGMFRDKYGIEWIVEFTPKSTMERRSPVVHFELPAEDMERMKAFYTKTFGWELLQFGEEMGGYVVAMTDVSDTSGPLKKGRINGGFYTKTPEMPLHHPSVVVAVYDMAQAMKDVQAGGGTIIGEPFDIPGVGKYVSFMDTEGNRLSMLQPLSQE